MTTFAMIAGWGGTVAFAVLGVLVLFAPSRSSIARLLVVVCAGSAAWFAAGAVYQGVGAGAILSLSWVQCLEVLRDGLWLFFLFKLLERAAGDDYRRHLRLAAVPVVVLLAVLLATFAAPYLTGQLLDADPAQVRKFYLAGLLAVAVVGLALTEQLFRNTSRGTRWALKHLCIGVAFIFAFDFYLYADAVLFNRLDPTLWSARGIINALAVPLIAISASRNREWDLNVFVSRRVVFHSVTLIAAGIYLMVMAAAGYYIQAFGGEWGRALKIAFLSAAVLILVSLFLSLQLRSRVRMFLARHFYRNKYEYGEEWLKFTQALSRTDLAPDSLNGTILNAIADIVDSPGGLIYRKLPSGGFAIAARLAMYDRCSEELPAGAPFLAELQERDEVWEVAGGEGLDEVQRAVTPPWLLALPRLALIVPVVYGKELLAFLVLAQPRSNQGIDDEDRDLLKTVGRQAASYLALLRATDALSEARQFETFNRLSAFLVHDLKNVVAQLSLITRNAERHGHNPEFVSDAFNTVSDAVNKMNGMLASLRQMQAEVEADDIVDLAALAQLAVNSKQDAEPAPCVAGGTLSGLEVRASRERLLAVIEHLVQNAIEATPADGNVTLEVAAHGREARLRIADTGCGMDREFINTRLFKPFDTTKGKAGMGIGAYESRHVVSSMGGELRVESEPGVGSCFTIVLPLASERAAAAAAPEIAEA